MSTNGKRPQGVEAQVPPGPVATQFFTQVITASDGTRWCLLTCLTLFGAMTYWLPPGLPGELAAMLGKADRELQESGSAGLIVPTVDVGEVLRKIEGGEPS